MIRCLPALVLTFICSTTLGLSAASAQRPKSPEVNQDRTVTFRAHLPYAAAVHVQINRVNNGKVEMKEDESGWWSGTSNEMPAGIHEYKIVVDGTPHVDILNRWIKEWYTIESLFEVPGEKPLVTELQSVPHGTLHHHTYRSKVTKSDRAVVVYTPPSYNPRSKRKFPVLFLLHGFGDDQTAWTRVGRAHYICDNLISQKKMKDMIVVMPYGHPNPLPYGERSEKSSAEYSEKNNRLMVREMDEVLLPWVEKNYRVIDKPDGRAVAGLSMGGGHSIRTALSLGKFSWVGAFSAAAPQDETPEELAKNLGRFKETLELMWIACGDKDFLLERNRKFVQHLEAASVEHQYVETKGSHNWGVWRDEYLPQFLPMLFR